mgnify:CR=1 FL=1
MDLFEEARRIINQGEICDSCLGQIFADRGHGLTNRERGNAWRTIFAMENGEMVDRHVGAVPKETLSSSINSNL